MPPTTDLTPEQEGRLEDILGLPMYSATDDHAKGTTYYKTRVFKGHVGMLVVRPAGWHPAIPPPAYVFNIDSGRPTRASPDQTPLPDDLIAELRKHPNLAC